MMKRKNQPTKPPFPFDPSELTCALEICRKTGSNKSVGSQYVENWQKSALPELEAEFGKPKTQEILEQLRKLETAFFSIPPKHSIGSSVIRDAEYVRKAFLWNYPTTPEGLVDTFYHRYLYTHR